jgi:PAS domain S-box-containing protein
MNSILCLSLIVACLVFLSGNIFFYFRNRKTKENFRLTLEASSDIVFLIDKDARYLDVFASQDNLLLASREKLIGRTVEEVLGPVLGLQIKSLIEKTFLTGKRQILAYEIILDSKLNYFEAIMERRDSSVVVATIRDVGERKALQQQIEIERIKQFESARLASLGEIAGSISHEVNTPLAIILASAQLLELNLKKDPLPIEKIAKQTQRIILTGNRIASIIKGLRALARDGSSDAFEFVPVENIVHNTLELCADKFRFMGIDIQVEVEKDLQIRCRSVQISQVLLNLLNNAFHAISLNQNLNKSLVIITAKKIQDEKIEIAVVDSGPGIPAEIKNRIFEPFFTTKSAGEGTGLGLSISSTIMNDHKGQLILDPSSQKTRFCMQFNSK